MGVSRRRKRQRETWSPKMKARAGQGETQRQRETEIMRERNIPCDPMRSTDPGGTECERRGERQNYKAAPGDAG